MSVFVINQTFRCSTQTRLSTLPRAENQRCQTAPIMICKCIFISRFAWYLMVIFNLFRTSAAEWRWFTVRWWLYWEKAPETQCAPPQAPILLRNFATSPPSVTVTGIRHPLFTVPYSANENEVSDTPSEKHYIGQEKHHSNVTQKWVTWIFYLSLNGETNYYKPNRTWLRAQGHTFLRGASKA